ncbi:type VII secretion protein EccB [Cellulomonas sp. KRMCY2]|uniref:type VII secretion protein EccB n=1 Tax=Cellulomonas sp. KRMCY2 TaxID=1304865 RepID=UPI0004B27837|nr:type VII secretion protein EccB [Cellulomonas sp. KRMCY2]
MATKKELIEAQTYSRRRLLTAFVSGAPGGRELEATKPMRGLVAGIALTVLLILGGLASGYLKPALKDGWDNNTLVTTDTGSRYVAVEGILYPVLNVTSARLMIPAGSFAVLQVGEDKIADAPRGVTRGIPGAPDALPRDDRLINTGWISCTAPTGLLATVLSDGPEVAAIVAEVDAAVVAAAADPTLPRLGVLVETAGEQYVVTDGRRHRVPSEYGTAVLRAMGLDTQTPWAVGALWLNLFPPGADLAPLVVDGVGSPVPPGVVAPPGALVGSVLTVTDDGRRYVVNPDGELAPLSDVADSLYRLGSGQAAGPDIGVTGLQIAGMDTAAQPTVPADWPLVAPQVLPAGDSACALLDTDVGPGTAPTVHLAASAEILFAADGSPTRIGVESAGGALVQSTAGPGLGGPILLIDQTGTAFPVSATDEILARLGYTAADVTPVPQEWIALFASGPALNDTAAAQPYQGATGS